MVELNDESHIRPVLADIPHPEIIEPPKGFVGFYWLSATMEQWDLGRGFIIPTLSKTSVGIEAYVAIPEKLPGLDEPVRKIMERLEYRYEVDDNEAQEQFEAGRWQLHNAISDYLKHQGWVKKKAFLPSKWFSGASSHDNAYVGGWFLQGKDAQNKPALFEPAPGIYLPYEARDAAGTVAKRGGWEASKLRKMISVQHVERFMSYERGNNGWEWVRLHNVEDEFAVIRDKRGEWIVEKSIPVLVRYLAVRFDAVVELDDLRSKKVNTVRVVFKDDTNINVFVGNRKWGAEQHVRILENLLKEFGINKHFKSEVDISPDKVRHTELKKRITKEGYLDDVPDSINDPGWQATIWNTTDCIQGYETTLSELAQVLSERFTKPAEVNHIAQSGDRPYAQYHYALLLPYSDIRFDQPFNPQLFARGEQVSGWVEVVTEDNSVYKFNTAMPQAFGQRRVFGVRLMPTGVIDGFVGVLGVPSVGEPLKFTEYAQFKLLKQREVLDDLRYADVGSGQEKLRFHLIETYSRVGRSLNKNEVNLDDLTSEYLQHKTLGVVKSIAVGRHPDA